MTAIVKEEIELSLETCAKRVEWCILNLKLRPYSVNWKDVVCIDEFRKGIGPQNIKKIKRRRLLRKYTYS
jgi:hypothetical protein